MMRQSADKNFAYILGVFLGDGCVTSMNRYTVFRLNTIDKDFAESVRESWKCLSNRPTNLCVHSVKKSSKPNHSLTCRDDNLCNRLVTETLKKRIIPDYVFHWPKELKLEFIGGLMDSEGFVSKNQHESFYMGYKSCDEWVPDFIRILQSVGIQIGKVSKEKPLHEGYKEPTRFHLKMLSWVESGAKFKIQRKQNRVNEWFKRSQSQRLPVEPHYADGIVRTS